MAKHGYGGSKKMGGKKGMSKGRSAPSTMRPKGAKMGMKSKMSMTKKGSTSPGAPDVRGGATAKTGSLKVTYR